MKFAALFLTLAISLSASAKNLQCLPEGEADGSVVELLNVENISRGQEFGARFLPKEQNVVFLATCGNPKDLPLVYCFFRSQAPGPIYFLKFESFNPGAAVNTATLQLQKYGQNNKVLRNYICQ